MKIPLDPVTAAKIEAFGRRRLRLILVRSLCAGAAVLLGTMSAVALVDSTVLLPDMVRLALSLGAYGLTAAAVWVAGARFLLRVPGPRELARHMERFRPGLREDLLSAVELGDSAPEDRGDSADFRRRLQESVAERLRDLPVGSLLTFRMISRWLCAAGVAIGLCVALLLVPGLRYDHLLLRTLLPTANLERFSDLAIRIVEPDPADRVVPQGDPAPIAVEISGPREPRTVVLELFAGGRPPQQTAMKKAGTRYEASIPMAREDVEYRIRADDAVSRRHTLSPRPRPDITRFEKTYHLPKYARRPPDRRPPEENGDLVAIEGSEAEILMEANQEISSGELRVEQGGQTRSVRLDPAGPRRLRARLPVSVPGTYRVHLVSGETGFENRYSPQYEIRPMPDLVPRVTLEEPSKNLVLPPEEIVSIRGSASDDLGVDRVLLMVRVNQAEWLEIPLDLEGGRVARRWDLHEAGVHPGDRVTLKLAAVDLKGGRAETPPLQVGVTSPGFDPQRHLPLAARQLVLDALDSFRASVRAMERRVREALTQAGKGDEVARQQTFLTLLDETGKVVRQADQLEELIREAARAGRPGREVAELALAARRVRRLREEPLEAGRGEIERATATKQVEEAFDRAADMADETAACFRDLVALDEATAARCDLADLAREQASIHRQLDEARASKDARAWERLARRQGVAAYQIRGVEDLLVLLGRPAAALASRRAALEKAPAGPALEGPSRELQREVESAWARLVELERELAPRGAKARETLERGADFSHAAVRRRGAAAQLEARARIEESRPDADAPFVADAALASRVLGVTLGEGIERAFRVLEAGHQLAELEIALRALADVERWEGPASPAAARHALEWGWLEERLNVAAEQFRLSGLPLDDLPAAWRGAAGVRGEMAQRTTPGRRPGSVVEDLIRLDAAARAALARAQPAMEEARKALALLVPGLAERLARLAESASKLERDTGGLAGRADRQDPGQVRLEARELLQSQQALDRQLDAVSHDLRRDANVQDLSSDEGRERARDADDAVAMLQQTPPRAEELLAEAASTAQERPLSAAADQQRKLADTLRQLAEHYRNLEKGTPQATRPGLRQAEDALGIRAALDAAYARAERLSDLATEKSPENQRVQLEQQLSADEAMQRKLETLAREALARAGESLTEAARREELVARKLDRLPPAQGAAEQAPIAAAIGEASEHIARAARHAERLGRAEEGVTLGQLSKDVATVATGEVAAAQKALEKAKSPAEARPAVAAAQRAIQDRRMALGRSGLAHEAPAPTADPVAQRLAQALNALDASKGRSGPGGGSVTQALQSAANAHASGMQSGRGQGGGAGGGPGGGSGGGASTGGSGRTPGDFRSGTPATRGLDWGRLPPQLVRDLLESQREGAAGDYRAMVETYFRVIAERAREGRK